MEDLLYRKDGVDWDCKIWYGFIEGRKMYLEDGRDGGKIVD